MRTLSSWFRQRRPVSPRLVGSLGELGDCLRTVVAASLPPGAQPRRIVFVPADFFSHGLVNWTWLPERAFVFLPDSLLYAEAASGSRPARARLACASDLLFVRSSLLLLYGLLDVETAAPTTGAPPGAAPSPTPEEPAICLEYDASGWPLLREGVWALLNATAPGGDAAAAAVENEALLRTLPFKFANGLRYHALQPGEPLLAAVFQPGILAESRGRARRPVTPNTLLALTGKSLILIEEQRVAARNEPEYGWIFTWTPRARVARIVSVPVPDGAEVLICMAWQGASAERRITLAPDVAAEWLAAWRAFG